MNNKELTEKIKKDITGILEEKSDLKLATSHYDSRVEGINAIVDYIIKTTQSNDDIKREAVGEFYQKVHDYLDINAEVYMVNSVFEIYENHIFNLNQKENNE